MFSLSILIYISIAVVIALTLLYTHLILNVEAIRFKNAPPNTLNSVNIKNNVREQNEVHLNDERNKVVSSTIEKYTNGSDAFISYPSSRIFAINFQEAFNGKAEFEIQLYHLKKYFNALSQALSQAQDSIYVLDYVEHGKEMEQSNDFSVELRKSYEAYFQGIEELVKKNPNIVYTRILQIPFGSDLKLDVKEDIVKYAMERLYSPTRKHIDALIGCNNFKIYVIPRAIRSLSEVVIDKAGWFIELDRYDANGAGKPDRLFSNMSTESAEIAFLVEEELQIIKSVLKNHQPVTREELTDVVREMQEDLAKQKRILEAEHIELANDFVGSLND